MVVFFVKSNLKITYRKGEHLIMQMLSL